MLLIKWTIVFFEAQKYIVFAYFNFLKMVIFATLFRCWSTLWNSTLKVTTLSNEVDNVYLTICNVVNFNVDIHNVVSTLIRHCPTSQCHITLTTTLRPCWKVSWVLTKVAKGLHNFVKFIKLKTYVFSRVPLNCYFLKLWKRYW